MSHQGNTFAARRGNCSRGRGGNHPAGRYSTRASGRPPPQGNPAAKKPRNQGPQPFKWGDSTFMVPQKLGPNTTQNEKNQFLEQTARTLRDHKSASWTGKAACLTLQFNYQTTHRRAVLKVENLVRGHPETNCFNPLFIECAGENFAAIAIPAGGIIAPFQKNCAFIACRITMINPIQAWAGLNSPPDPTAEFGFAFQRSQPWYQGDHNLHQGSILPIQDRLQNHLPLPHDSWTNKRWGPRPLTSFAAGVPRYIVRPPSSAKPDYFMIIL